MTEIITPAHAFTVEALMVSRHVETFAEIGVLDGLTLYYILERPPVCLKAYWAIDPYSSDIDVLKRSCGKAEFIEKGIHPVKAVMNGLFIEMASYKVYRNREQLHILREFSSDAVERFQNNYFDMIFIDGDHSYEGVRSDLDNYFPKMKPGGYILGHDIDEPVYPGVTKAVHQFVKENKNWIGPLDRYGITTWGFEVCK
jgi:hypothetical protein